MLDNYDIYLAGPFFNDAQKAKMDKVKAMLEAIGYVVADPRDLGPVIVDAPVSEKTPNFFRNIFMGNIEGMDRSIFCLACLDEKDVGTAFELGYFYNSDKAILSFAFAGGKTNVMLGQAVDFHSNTFEELEQVMVEEFSSFQELGKDWWPKQSKTAGSDE